jgi:hypothetical protein
VSAITKRDAIDAAMSVAEDVAEGRVDPAALDQAAADECRELFGTVADPDDPIWPLQVDVARQVLAADGLSADELSEWLAVARSRAGEPVSTPQPPVDPPAVTEPVSAPSGAEIDLPEAEHLTEPESQVELASAADTECGCDEANPAMVELPDGRRIPSRLIAARGRGLPFDGRL